MKYFLDTEFLEGRQEVREPKLLNHILILISMFALGYSWYEYHIYNDVLCAVLFATVLVNLLEVAVKRYTKNTIDLISIGIVGLDGREYYAISKDFDLDEAWYRYDIQKIRTESGGVDKKVYWIRDNVLKPIFEDLLKAQEGYLLGSKGCNTINTEFTYSNFKKLRKQFGKTNKEIVEDIKEFVGTELTVIGNVPNVQFYTYYGAYDWVVFCWLFGRMIDLPNNFPMYSNDLIVLLKDTASNLPSSYWEDIDTGKKIGIATLDDKIQILKSSPDYPIQLNSHNALDDAKWNLALYNFLTKK